MRQSNDLHLLPNISTRTREALFSAGFCCLQDIATSTPDDLRQVKGIKTTAESVHAHACAYTRGQPQWLAPMPPDVIDAPCAYLDIETDPMSNRVWSITVRADDTAPSVILVCAGRPPAREPEEAHVTVVRTQADAWALAHEIVPANTPILHWTGFDAGVMRQTAAPDTRALLDARMKDLHALVKTAVAFPLRSRSLKAVAPYLGFQWKTYADWSLALMDFQRWSVAGDMQAYSRMMDYICDDVDAMYVVLSWLRANRQ